jgi:hypothetical protein
MPELGLLEEACRSLDTLDRIEAVLAVEPMMTAGTNGVMRPHPCWQSHGGSASSSDSSSARWARPTSPTWTRTVGR